MQKLIARLDGFQRSHRGAGFVYGVIKKSSNDQLGYQAALVTYYAFLALFPLILVATTILQLILRSHQHLQAQVLNSVNRYLPVLGSDLQHNIHSFHKSGVALLIGIVITLYGARGVAGALQNAFNHVWQVPRVKRPGFPKNLTRSFGLIIIGGAGFLLAATLSSLAAGLGRSEIFTIISILISLAVLFATFLYIFRFGTASVVASHRSNYASALETAIGLQILQIGGGFLLAHEIKHFDVLYGTFAVVLGLLFWIYLQVQVVLYSLEIATVRSFKLWPRSLTGKDPTPQDERAYELAAKRDKLTR